MQFHNGIIVVNVIPIGVAYLTHYCDESLAGFPFEDLKNVLKYCIIWNFCRLVLGKHGVLNLYVAASIIQQTLTLVLPIDCVWRASSSYRTGIYIQVFELARDTCL